MGQLSSEGLIPQSGRSRHDERNQYVTQRRPNGADAYSSLADHRGPALAATHAVIASGAGAAALGQFSSGKPVAGFIFAGLSALQIKFAYGVTKFYGQAQHRNGENAEAARWSRAVHATQNQTSPSSISEITQEQIRRDSPKSISR